MRINVSGRDVGLPQHFLDDTQVGSIFHEVTCKGVSKGVRMNIFGDSSSAPVLIVRKVSVFVYRGGFIFTAAIQTPIKVKIMKKMIF